MRTEAYAQWSGDLHGRVRRERLPLNATIELTRRCNLTCQHCYNNLPVGDAEARKRELTLDELTGVLDQMAAAGCLWLLLTGGEIFSRPDFMAIYAQAKARGFLITLFTNATMVTDEIADALAAAPPFSIEVTLYGATRATYERLTGVVGSYDRCLRGIDRLLARGLPLKLKAAVTTVNVHELDEMKRLAESKVTGVFRSDAMINPRIDCSAAPLRVRLAPFDVVALDARDVARVDDWRRTAAQQAQHTPPADDLYVCGGGIGSFAIDPYGAMTLCVLSQKDRYDLRTGTVEDGWRTFLGQVRSRKVTRRTKCVGCGIKALCGMCPANGELHGDGDPEAPVAFLCETAHLRAHAFGIEVPPHEGCELCPGGERHPELHATAARLQALVAAPHADTPATPLRHLPVLTDVARSGCNDCGAA